MRACDQTEEGGRRSSNSIDHALKWQRRRRRKGPSPSTDVPGSPSPPGRRVVVGGVDGPAGRGGAGRALVTDHEDGLADDAEAQVAVAVVAARRRRSHDDEGETVLKCGQARKKRERTLLWVRDRKQGIIAAAAACPLVLTA